MDKVFLLNGIFEVSRKKGKEYLLDLDADRLLAPCYEAAGRTPKKPRYGGWESKAISGHSLGHFLSALSSMYLEDNDYVLKQKIDYIVSELGYLQSLDEDGYVSGFPRTCFDKVFSGEFTSSRFELGGSWVPWYSIHKIYAGLIDAYNLTNNNQALEVVTKLADWAVKGTNKLNDEQFEKMIYCEHGGMCESMADLYKITKNEAYLKLAIRFIDKEIMNPIFDLKDELEGKHANTQIPKVIGAAKLYEILSDERYKKASEFFWKTVTKNRSYVIGGNSRDEHFEKAGTENLGVTTAETCNTYNMLKLTEHLYSWNHDKNYIDYYERALYNHILASQDPDTGMKTYFVSTKPGHFKVYCSKENSFWCCTGTGMENPGRYTREIYYRDNDELYVNLFIGSKIVIDEKDMEISQETNFPESNETVLTFDKSDNEYMDLKIRVPYWIAEDMVVYVNDNEKYTDNENGYISIKRKWNKGDIVKISLPMDIHIYKAKDDSNKIVFMYGPIVLAGALGRECFPDTDILEDHLKLNLYPDISVPVLAADDIEKYIKKADKQKLIFEINGICEPGHRNIRLIPFYNLHHQRYTIYWRKMTNEEYKNNDLSSRDYSERLNEISIDLVNPHEQQSEIEHKIQSFNSKSDYDSECGKGWRECSSNGYFSYQMKIDSSRDMYLCMTYWGSDKEAILDEKRYMRKFNIYVDDNLIASEVLNENKPYMLYDKFYQIPEDLTKGKSKISIKISSNEQEIGGRVFGVRITTEKM